jgi:hypothetical protein
MKIFITALNMDERKEGLSILIREWLCPVTGLSERWFISGTVKAPEQLNYS